MNLKYIDNGRHCRSNTYHHSMSAIHSSGHLPTSSLGSLATSHVLLLFCAPCFHHLHAMSSVLAACNIIDLSLVQTPMTRYLYLLFSINSRHSSLASECHVLCVRSSQHRQLILGTDAHDMLSSVAVLQLLLCHHTDPSEA